VIETEEILRFFAENELIRDAQFRLDEYQTFVKRVGKNVKEVEDQKRI
jgi:hypothetical protein